MKKPKWVIAKEQAKRTAAQETVWLFGLHAVRDALENPKREKLRLIVTRNAMDKLADAIAASGMEPEISDPRKFAAPLDPQSVHQGAALEVKPHDWGKLEEIALGDGPMPPRIVLLDRVTDPHNVGAILRSAEVFGARAVVAMSRHAAPETGALAKTASGALERQPYVRVRNLADAIVSLQDMGYTVLGLDGTADGAHMTVTKVATCCYCGTKAALVSTFDLSTGVFARLRCCSQITGQLLLWRNMTPTSPRETCVGTRLSVYCPSFHTAPGNDRALFLWRRTG